MLQTLLGTYRLRHCAVATSPAARRRMAFLRKHRKIMTRCLCCQHLFYYTVFYTTACSILIVLHDLVCAVSPALTSPQQAFSTNMADQSWRASPPNSGRGLLPPKGTMNGHQYPANANGGSKYSGVSAAATATPGWPAPPSSGSGGRSSPPLPAPQRSGQVRLSFGAVVGWINCASRCTCCYHKELNDRICLVSLVPS